MLETNRSQKLGSERCAVKKNPDKVRAQIKQNVGVAGMDPLSTQEKILIEIVVQLVLLNDELEEGVRKLNWKPQGPL